MHASKPLTLNEITYIVVQMGKRTNEYIYMALLPGLPDTELVVHGKNMFVKRRKHGIGGGTYNDFSTGELKGCRNKNKKVREQEMKGIEIEKTTKSVPI